MKNTAMFKSCRNVVVRKGIDLAVPYTSSAAVTRNNSYSVKKSITHQEFNTKQYLHVGMKTKPLLPYTPDSYRNRLRTAVNARPKKNTSQIVLGQVHDKKQFVSMARAQLKPPRQPTSKNPGILSERAKRNNLHF